MPKTLCFRKGDLASCISQFIHPSKLIREKYPSSLKSHKFKNLVLIAEAKNTICKNTGVINVYTFSLVDFEGVELYASRRYVHLTKEGRKEDFFSED